MEHHQDQDFDQSYYVLCVIGYWILATDALDTPEGREKIRAGFRDAMLSAGGYESLQTIPEFRKAMIDIAAAAEKLLLVDESEVSPLSTKEGF
jgi:hypothetical protein